MIGSKRTNHINLDASARPARRKFLFHQRFLVEKVYFLILLNFFIKKWGDPATPNPPAPPPARALNAGFSLSVKHGHTVVKKVEWL